LVSLTLYLSIAVFFFRFLWAQLSRTKDYLPIQVLGIWLMSSGRSLWLTSYSWSATLRALRRAENALLPPVEKFVKKVEAWLEGWLAISVATEEVLLTMMVSKSVILTILLVADKANFLLEDQTF
jgi:hypothetical protein